MRIFEEYWHGVKSNATSVLVAMNLVLPFSPSSLVVPDEAVVVSEGFAPSVDSTASRLRFALRWGFSAGGFIAFVVFGRGSNGIGCRQSSWQSA